MKRVEWIDTAKGICILLVVFNHICIYSGVLGERNNYIIQHSIYFLTSFRMPLYFFLSGLFFKTYGGGAPFVKKKVNKLLIPFLFFYIISADLIPSLYYCLTDRTLYGINNLSLLRQLHDVCYDYCQATNGPIWFLLCLFEVNILFCCISIISKENMCFIYIQSVIFGIIGLFLSYFHILLPLTLSTSFTCLPFFAFGYFVKKSTNLLYSSMIDNYLIIISIACALFLWVVARHVVYYKNEFCNSSYFTAHICGIIGTMMIFLLSKYIGTKPFVTFYGKYSLITLCTHYPLFVLFDNFLFCHMQLFGWYKVLAAFLLIILTELMLIPLMIKYLPYVTAQKDLLK
jgi:fucose 4-O-acetylase-like acetyltransferase